MNDNHDAGFHTLLKAARDAAGIAYAPYSNVAQGAAVQTSDGAIFAGCNVELVSWAGSICAEAAAIAAAVAHGKRQIVRIALVPYRYPCGVCLQLLSEFGEQIEIISADAGGKIITRHLPQLLPHGFSKANYR